MLESKTPVIHPYIPLRGCLIGYRGRSIGLPSLQANAYTTRA